MKIYTRRFLLLGGALVMLFCAQVRAEPMYATDGLGITSFDSTTPATTNTVAVSGLQAGETLIGIDIRPSNGLLYGIGSMSRLYTINPLSGLAMQVGSAGAFTLNGTFFGTDFNPVPDRIRQVSNTEQNLRIHPDTGALAFTDGALNPAGNVVAVAYSNNFAGAATTTLYAIDSVSGTLGIISVPNSGGPINLVGSLGLGTNLNENIGFDISGLTGIAYATIFTGAAAPLAHLYSIDLTTGQATDLGVIGDGANAYLGLTAATAVPEPSSFMLLAGAAGLFGVYRRFRRAKS